MNKKKIKEFEYVEPVFHATIVVRIETPTDPYFQALVTVQEKKNKNGTLHTRYLLQMEDQKDFYTLGHECLHLTKSIFRDRGIPFTAENDEVIAYYQEHLVKTLWRQLNKK